MLGATKAEQLEENLGALDVVAKLGDAEMVKIDLALG
jgi:aryl-alcohol dehydrogenase-like predicted oxidoreductase